jgi:UDP-3-O-[3-hydroxymyristoyl] N-acetylglucosamine deacetylase
MSITLRAPTRRMSGIGVYSGQQVSVRVLPGSPYTGLVLHRTDLDRRVQLHLSRALDIPHCTAVGNDRDTATLYLEHLMATLHARGITDATVEVNGPELPVLDGSAVPWCELIPDESLVYRDGGGGPLVVAEEITVTDGDRTIRALPPEREYQALFTYELEYSHPLIGKQTARFDLSGDAYFDDAIAPARTFALIEEIDAAQSAGLLKDGSEDNCRIVYADHLSSPTTLPQEFARHKILDMLGDLYLLGRPVVGQFTGHLTGHAHNRELLRRIAACGNM